MIRRYFPRATGWLVVACTVYAVSGFLTAEALAKAVSRTVSAQSSSAQTTDAQPFVNQYCVTCHNQRLKTAGLTLDTLDIAHVDQNAEIWEKVVRKIKTGMMPPSG